MVLAEPLAKLRKRRFTSPEKEMTELIPICRCPQSFQHQRRSVNPILKSFGFGKLKIHRPHQRHPVGARSIEPTHRIAEFRIATGQSRNMGVRGLDCISAVQFCSSLENPSDGILIGGRGKGQTMTEIFIKPATWGSCVQTRQNGSIAEFWSGPNGGIT